MLSTTSASTLSTSSLRSLTKSCALSMVSNGVSPMAVSSSSRFTETLPTVSVALAHIQAVTQDLQQFDHRVLPEEVPARKHLEVEVRSRLGFPRAELGARCERVAEAAERA